MNTFSTEPRPDHALQASRLSPVAELEAGRPPSRLVRTGLLTFFGLVGLLAAEPQPSTPLAVPMGVALREAEERWRAVEPELFTDAGQKHIGAWVRCGGAPTSLRAPVTIKLASGTIVRLTKLQGADRDELATFRKPPSVVIVRGPILAIDRATRTVTIKAVSTMFEQ